MNKLIEFNAPGGTVLVETSEMAGSPMRGAGMSQLTEKIGMSFEDTLSVIRPVANAAFAAIRELAATPETVEVDFSRLRGYAR